MPKTQDYTLYPTLQITKINTAPFVFINNSAVNHPVAPILSAKFYEDNGLKKLKVRATLYIDSEVTADPFVEIPELDPNQNDVLTINYCFDFQETIPESCNVWYIELDYCTPEVSNIKEVLSYLINIDPQISRGTRLSVAD